MKPCTWFCGANNNGPLRLFALKKCSLFGTLSTQNCIAPLWRLDTVRCTALLGLQNAWHRKPVSTVHLKHMRRLTEIPGMQHAATLVKHPNIALTGMQHACTCCPAVARRALHCIQHPPQEEHPCIPDTWADLHHLHHTPLQPEHMFALHHSCWLDAPQLLKPTC